jgi:hypothetical protein
MGELGHRMETEINAKPAAGEASMLGQFEFAEGSRILASRI